MRAILTRVSYVLLRRKRPIFEDLSDTRPLGYYACYGCHQWKVPLTPDHRQGFMCYWCEGCWPGVITKPARRAP